MTIIADIAETFPQCPTFGFIAEPNYLVKIVAREGGFERRDRKWSRPLLKFSSVPTGDQRLNDILDILDFWHAMGGMSSGFRFKDWTDYKSCRPQSTAAATDQPLLATTDSPHRYRLVKEYITKTGRTIQQREITRPIGSTLLIANETGALQDGSHWSLDESTGVLTIGSGFVGVPTAWGGSFDVWVRFDAQFNPTISSENVGNVTVQLAEIRMPLA